MLVQATSQLHAFTADPAYNAAAKELATADVRAGHDHIRVNKYPRSAAHCTAAARCECCLHFQDARMRAVTLAEDKFR
jgi:hypothetical protein